MKAIILAAGTGNRLGDLGKKVPKCLIQLGNETILERNLELLVKHGIKKEDIVIVIGGKGDVWTKDNQEQIKRIHANVIINEENVNKNQAYSFWLGTKDIHDDLICLDGDSVFHEKALQKLIESKHDSCLLTRLVPAGEKRMRVLVENERIIGFGKELTSDRVYTPLLKMSASFLEALKRELMSKPELHFMTGIDKGMEAICAREPLYHVGIEDYPGEKGLYININTPENYDEAQRLFA